MLSNAGLRKSCSVSQASPRQPTVVPSIQAIPTNVEITLGQSTAAQFASATQFLRRRVKEITGIFHICQLAGDSEAVAVNTNDFNKLIQFPSWDTPHPESRCSWAACKSTDYQVYDRACRVDDRVPPPYLS